LKAANPPPQRIKANTKKTQQPRTQKPPHPTKSVVSNRPSAVFNTAMADALSKLKGGAVS
jgi:hypothetical protein